MTAVINPSSKKFALVIGINYTGTNSQLNGCINDALHLKAFLIDKCGYLQENIMVLIDDIPTARPTKQNIIAGFNTLVSKAINEQFTELWVSYSGHGSYVIDTSGDESDRRDEVICPLDYPTAGMITDDFIYANLVAKLPATATLFALMDSCNSGTVLDLPYVYDTALTTNNANTRHVANVTSISGCRDNQTSADAYIQQNYEGAMTWSFLNTLSITNYNVTLVDLITKMRVLLRGSYTQIPILALSTQPDLNRYLITSVPVTPPDGPNSQVKEVTFDMTVDYWYDESTWNVWSFQDNGYVFTQDNGFTAQYQNNIIAKALPIGQYKLVVKDAYGDGGVTSKVTCGLVTLVSANMTSGQLAEYTFTV